MTTPIFSEYLHLRSNAMGTPNVRFRTGRFRNNDYELEDRERGWFYNPYELERRNPQWQEN